MEEQEINHDSSCNVNMNTVVSNPILHSLHSMHYFVILLVFEITVTSRLSVKKLKTIIVIVSLGCFVIFKI